MILDNKGISQKKFFVLSGRAGYKQELFYSYINIHYLLLRHACLRKK